MERVKDAMRVTRALADSTRLRLVHLLAQREFCVRALVEILGVSQPAVSRHLGILRAAGLVECAWEGRFRCYRLRRPARGGRLGQLLDVFLESISADPMLVEDRRLAAIIDRRSLRDDQ